MNVFDENKRRRISNLESITYGIAILGFGPVAEAI
jgi:hypothetical protein